MKKSNLITSAVLSIVLLALLMFFAINLCFAPWPGPDYDCKCDHTHDGYPDDEWTGTGIKGFYYLNPPVMRYASGWWEFTRGYGGMYPPSGSMICDYYIDATHYTNYIYPQNDWITTKICNKGVHIKGLTQSLFPIPWDPTHYRLIGSTWANVWASGP